MISHLVLAGVSDGALGIGLDIVAAAQRVSAALEPVRGRPDGALQQRVLSVDGNSVSSGANRTVAVDGALEHIRFSARDVLVLPGLGAATPGQIRALLERPEIPAVQRAISRAVDRGATVIASCSATFLLASAGVLDGREATTTWWLVEEFAKRFSRVVLTPDRMVVESGPTLTAGAAFAHADVMLALLHKRLGGELTHRVASYLLLDRRVSQTRYMVTEHIRSSDTRLRTLESFLVANMSRQVSLAEMAAVAAMSPRSLARLLSSTLHTTPHKFALQVKMTKALHLIETTTTSIDEISRQVGFAEPAAFRKRFRQVTGVAPSACRSRAASVAER